MGRTEYVSFQDGDRIQSPKRRVLIKYRTIDNIQKLMVRVNDADKIFITEEWKSARNFFKFLNQITHFQQL
jgi:hypothetical protein